MDGSYTNGYSNHSSGRYGNGTYSHDRVEQSGYFSGDRRPGGYGGFDAPSQNGRVPSGGYTRQPSGQQRRTLSGINGRRRTSRSRSRSRTGEGRAEKQIEDVLYYIKNDWDFMTEDRCVPVQVALRLLDESSLGLASRWDEFQNAQTQLQEALRGIVNEHHQGFNSSIGTFHQIQASIQSSHDRVRSLKTRLTDAKANLTTTKSEFQTLVTTSRDLEGMLDVMTKIEEIKQVPELLESLISEKRFLNAVDCLQDGLRLANGKELEHIGALSDVKLYLSNQEHALTDILTEELHNHLYLKSPYCEERWTSYEKIYRNDGPTGQQDLIESNPRPLYAFLDQLDTSVPPLEDTARNPEADSFHYIYTIVESLVKLGRLEDAVDAVEQRLPVELYKVVERTNGEVEQRHLRATRSATLRNKKLSARSFNNLAQKAVVEDLLGTLYARFEAIAESHRVFHEVIVGVSKRELGYSKPQLIRGFRELWKLYQSEIRSLLHDYLSADGSASQRSGQNSTGEGNMFRNQRDKYKKCAFKIDLIDSNDPDMKHDRDEVTALWQKFVPGLVSLPKKALPISMVSSNRTNDSSGMGHKLLVEPDVFNISSSLPPSLFFLKRFKDLVPSGSDIVINSLTTFLNDFLINVFHPQLEETLTEFCSHSYLELDAFQSDPRWNQHAQKPIVKSSITFCETIIAFCKMLDNLTHDQLFSKLVIKQIHGYLDRCNGWYKALVTRAQPKPNGQNMKVSAWLAETGAFKDTISQIWAGEPEQRQNLLEKEAFLLMNDVGIKSLDASDLLSDQKTQGSLCVLYTSMKWTAIKLSSLRHVSNRAIDSSDMDDSEERPQMKRSLTESLLSAHDSDVGSSIHLPLNENTADLFDGIVDGFQELAESIVRTLQLELRCQALQVLSDSFKGPLLFSEPPDSPDASILALVKDLLELNQELKTFLQPQEYEFVTTGLSMLLDSVLVHAIGTNITAMNAHGAAYMQLNVRVLYHNLLNVEANADLPRSFSYLRLYSRGPDAIVAAAAGGSAGIPPGTFSVEELKALLRLRYAEPAQSQDAREAALAKESLGVKMQQLDEIARRDSQH